MLIRESGKMMFKNKWFLTKMEKACLSAGLLVSRTTDPGVQCLFWCYHFCLMLLKNNTLITAVSVYSA